MIIGGLDVGTTGCKIVLYNENADLLDTYYREDDAIHKDGTHEIDFGDVKNGVLALLKEATSSYKLDALGVTSFGETFAMLDDNDNILADFLFLEEVLNSLDAVLVCALDGNSVGARTGCYNNFICAQGINICYFCIKLNRNRISSDFSCIPCNKVTVLFLI